MTISRQQETRSYSVEAVAHWLEVGLGGWHIFAMPAPIKKLSDRFADYDLSIKCKKCGHVRVTDPHALAKILGWEATLETVAARLRCSRCHSRGQSELSAQPQRRPRGVEPAH
jgi:hypothetical protein